MDWKLLSEGIHAIVCAGKDLLVPYHDRYGVFLSALGLGFAAYGCIKVTKFVFSETKVLLFGRWLTIDLVKQGKWAVVTGATDGIGKAYCEELAKRGLNIVLIARSPDKLAAVAKQIESTTSISTKCITADFSHTPDFYQHIEEELENMDIGVLVNNVGMSQTSKNYLATYDKYLKEDIVNMVSVNFLSCLMMSRIVLPGMIKRKRGVVVNISSGAIYMWEKQNVLYYCTKVAMDRMSAILREQNEKTGVTVQSVTPFMVKSNMTAKYDRQMGNNPFFPTATQYVRQAINTIGLQDQTCGYFLHTVQWCVFLGLLPSFIRRLIVTRLKKKATDYAPE